MSEIVKLAQNKGLNEIEVYSKDVTSKEIKFENNVLKNINTTQNSGSGLRGVYQNKLGVCSYTNMNDAAKGIERLIESAKFSDDKEYDFAKPSKYSNPKTYDASVEKVDMEKLVQDGQKMIDEIRQYDKQVLTSVSFQIESENTKFSNSLGTEGEYKSSGFVAYLSGKVIDGTSFIETDTYKYGIDANYDVNQLINTFIERMKLARVESKHESGRTKVMFTPKALVDILTTVTQGVNGNAVEKGISPLCNRLNEKIFDDRFTIIDDGTVDGFAGSRPFDDEGVAVKKRFIIENGVLKSYIHSLKTAAKTKYEPTGNGHRGSYDVLPTPGFNNMIISPGEKSFEEMLELMDNGIIIDEIMGLSMNNLLNGDFGGNIQLGFKVKSGKIEGRVKNAVFNSNIYKILNGDLLQISNLDYNHPIVNNVFTKKKQPCALFKDMNVVIK